MSKSYLLSFVLFIATCFITPLAFSTLPFTIPNAKNKPAQTIAVPVLAPQDFINTVDSNNNQVQKGLDATLTKLLGTATNALPGSAPTTNPPADTSTPTPAAAPSAQTQTPAAATTPSSAAPATPASTGTFNPYTY